MGRQINFFMMPEDVAELEQYIKDSGLMIVAETMPTKEPKVLEHLVEPKNLGSYIFNPKHKDLLTIEFIEKQNKYWINEMRSPVVEFTKSVFNQEEKTLHLGRLYYNKTQLSSDNSATVLKDEEFIQIAENILKWYKKHFKNTKINTWYTTPRVLEWTRKENGKLINS